MAINMPTAVGRLASDAAFDQDSPEMSLRQRALVDTCFEEGQYESAISILDQLRSPTYKPSVSHLRQLIYIALHPIITAQPEKSSKLIGDSPSKIQVFARTPLSSAAVVAAQQLLLSFALTQAPSSLARALPCYGSPGGVPGYGDDMGDSDISRESLCINEAKDCWSILVDGFLSRGKVLFSSPKRKSRRRYDGLEDESYRVDDETTTVNRDVVGESAWPVLDWFLTLFERDERLTLSQENLLYSPLILNQIPPTYNGRWDVTTPLAIVTFCFQQSDFRKQKLGMRLMALLTNLSLTPFLDFSMFIASLSGYFSITAPDKIFLLLSSLPPSLSNHQFKVAFCYKVLNEAELGPGRLVASNHSKPPARARKPRSTQDTQKRQVNPVTAPAVNTFRHLPSGEAVLHALENRMLSTVDSHLQLRIKFDLFFSYGTIQNEVPDADKDTYWASAVQQARLLDTMRATFNADWGEGAVKYRCLAESVLSEWSRCSY